MKTGALVLLFAAALTALWPLLSPLAARAALASAVLTMPEGSIAALRQRFADLTEEPPHANADPEQPPHSSAVPPLVGPKEGWVWPRQVPSSEPPVLLIQPEIPEEQRGDLISENFSGYDGGPFVHRGNMWLRNYTDFTGDELLSILNTPMKLKMEQTDQPQVLIYHTHATESYCPYDSDVYDRRYNWRSTDNNNNMVAVGAVMAQALREAGIGVVHDTTQHDYPSYNGSYQSSHDSVVEYLERYPTIKVALDIHRDAIERDGGVIVKPTVEIDGLKYAQLMIVSNCDDGSGLIPAWRENLRLAAAFDDRLQTNNKGITRPILFSHRKYNQELSTGSLLLEFGSHASTLEEAKRTARLAGEALAQVLKDTLNGT